MPKMKTLLLETVETAERGPQEEKEEDKVTLANSKPANNIRPGMTRERHSVAIATMTTMAMMMTATQSQMANSMRLA
jgi:hypothetical protein